MSSVNVLSTYKKFATDGKRGGQDDGGNYILISGGTDKIIINSDALDQSDGTQILLSPYTCTNLMLQSGTTDTILLSGTTDRLLIAGYCTSNILVSQRRMRRSG